MPQIRIPRGSHGEITTKQQPDGRWAARAQVRDIDGRIRSVRVKDSTKGGALRAIRQRLEKRVDPTIKGITADTTYDTLAALWLQHRKDHGKVRTKGKLAPQTLATYHAEIQHVIIPAIGKVRVGEPTSRSWTGSSPTSNTAASTATTSPASTDAPPDSSEWSSAG